MRFVMLRLIETNIGYTSTSAQSSPPANKQGNAMTPGESPSPLAPPTQSLRSLPDSRAALLIAGVAVVAALAARLAWPFDGLYGQDAFAYFRYARALWPWLLRGEPLPIYYWPAGYPLLVALALPLLGGSSAVGQAVSIASIAVAAACTFLLSRELLPDAPGGRLAAWVAGLAVALCGDALRAGLVTMSDALALACCTAAILALARYRRTRRNPDEGRGGRWLAAAAVALGWAVITRWVCGLLAVPMALSVLSDYLTKDEGRRTNERRLERSFVVGRWSLVVGLPALIIHTAAALALGAAIVVPQVLLSQRTPESLSQHQWVVTWNVANIWRRDFVTVDGAQHYRLPVGAYYLAHMAWPSLLFPPLALLAIPGALWLAWRRRWPALALLAGWPLLLWLFLSGIPYQNARFILPALPALAALAGLGFGWAYERTNDDRRPVSDNSARQPIVRVRPRSSASYFLDRRTSGWARVMLVIALVASLAGSLAWGLRDYRNLVVYKNEQLALVDWARARLPAGGTLITFGATLTLQHYTDYDVRELFYLAAPDLDLIAQQPQPSYLLLDVGNIESQWVGLRPQQDYHYLQQRPGLDIVGRRGPYTLFRIKSL
jgi:4-amino-4-deoxy-L-arabinose transferase-like glycosyltransferase